MWDWSRPYPVWLYATLAVVIVAGVLAARSLAISPKLRRWTLFLPRLCVFGLLGLILMNPVRRDELPLPALPDTLIYLVDCSRSMALDEPVSRLEQVKQRIQEADARTSQANRSRVQLFSFGEQLASAADLPQLQPVADHSRLEDALARLPSRFSGPLPRGVVVFSDGTVGAEFPSPTVVETYRRLGVPVHVYPVGDPRVRGDVAIQELILPRRAEKGAKVPIRTVLRSQGLDGQRTVVQVRPADRPQAEPLVSLPVTLTGGSQSLELVVEASPDLGELMLEAAPLAEEALVNNNRVPFQLAVANRKIKVLYLEGTGGDEYRWVHNALIEDQDIECVSMVADQQYVQRPRLMRVQDPYKGFPATREELFQYDCVICSDISRGAFTPEQLDWTVELVAQRGGGFAMVGGITSFGAGAWDQTVWDQLIPVDMTGGRVGQGWLYHQFRVRVPEESARHPIWRILEDETANGQALAQMPLFLGTNFIHRLKPAATALAYSATPIPGVGIMPVFACEPYGRGRTFAFAPDTTADWGRWFESQWGVGDNRYFRRFWRNVVRWLTENSVAGNRRLQVETDRLIYRLGQPIEITARAYDDALQETTSYQIEARLGSGTSGDSPGTPGQDDSRAAGAIGTVSLTADPVNRSYRGSLPAQLARHRVSSDPHEFAGLVSRDLEVRARQGDQEIARTTVKIQLLQDSEELHELRPTPTSLQQLAAATQGQVLGDVAALSNVLRDSARRETEVVVTRSPLWDRGPFWGLLLVLLSIEWVLRRLAGFG